MILCVDSGQDLSKTVYVLRYYEVIKLSWLSAQARVDTAGDGQVDAHLLHTLQNKLACGEVR
jgi:hypothetical protein